MNDKRQTTIPMSMPTRNGREEDDHKRPTKNIISRLLMQSETYVHHKSHRENIHKLISPGV